MLITKAKTLNVHTLGPTNTNCENAARHWAKKKNIKVNIVLHPQLEVALEVMKNETEECYLLGCAVYPHLHDIVFKNLDWLTFDDSFIVPTLEMVLAIRPEVDVGKVKTVYTHPAPASLVGDYKVEFATSNSAAAKMCKEGHSDGCVTTITSALENNLKIAKSFGEINMCFTLHKKKSQW